MKESESLLEDAKNEHEGICKKLERVLETSGKRIDELEIQRINNENLQSFLKARCE